MPKTLGIENSNFTKVGKQDVDVIINEALAYKHNAPKKDPKSSPKYWAQFPVDELFNQLLDGEETEAEWNFVTTDQLKKALINAGFTVQKLHCVLYSGEIVTKEVDHIILSD